MQPYFVELPDIYSSYFKPNILEIVQVNRHLWNHLDYHDLYRVDQYKVLTVVGLIRFYKCGADVDIFRVPPNFTSSIHVDNSIHAFNFIITNNGVMEWFDPGDLIESNKNKWNVQNFSLKQGAAPVCTTTSNLVWVNTRIPHRITNNSDVERICISVRAGASFTGELII